MNESALSKITALVAELCQALHRDRIAMLADKLTGENIGPLSGWQQCVSPKVSVVDVLTRLYRSAVESNIQPILLRGMLLGASRGIEYAASLQKIELIWTGPASQFAPTRRTEQALLELINAATEKLFITSFVAYKVDSLMAALQACIAKGVTVSVLLEESQLEGGTLTFDSLALLKKELPGARFYSWSPSGGEFVGGRVHAKVAVSDSRLALVSSANLTGHAMEKNMEAGVLIQGGDLPTQLHDHLDGLVDVGAVLPR